MAKPKAAAGNLTESKPDSESLAADAPLLEEAEAAPVAAEAEPAKPEATIESAEAKPAPTAPGGSALYKVWPYGALIHDGKKYEPGAELSLPTEIGDAIVCLMKL